MMTTYDKGHFETNHGATWRCFCNLLYLHDYFDALITLESHLEYIGVGKFFLIHQCFFLLFDTFLFSVLPF